jgi:hypothetical protein
MKREKVFVSYSHRDKEWLDRLQTHLRPLEREGLIERWDDTRIEAGLQWHEEIRSALASSKVAVLLVSADFLASEFIATEELPSLLASAEAQGLVILPMIISPSRFDKTPLARFQSVNSPSRPLAGLSTNEQEAMFVQMANAVERAIGSSTADKESASESRSDQRNAAAITGAPGSGGARLFPHRFKASWILAGIGLATLLVVAWLLIPVTADRVPAKPGQTEITVHAESGVAAGGDINAGDISISAPQPGPQHGD